MKESFVFLREWKDALAGSSDEVRQEVYEAIIEYGLTGTQISLKPTAMAVFSCIKMMMDKARDISDKRRAAVKKRWENKVCMDLYIQNDTNVIQNDTKPNSKNIDNNSSGSISSINNNIKKETPSGGKKEVPAASFDARQKAFYDSLVPFVQTYGADMIRHFYDYWTEPNKSHTKMRFELERTYSLEARLRTWASREFRYGTAKDKHRTTKEVTAQAQDFCETF